MPASAFSEGPMGELTRHNSLEDQRALQVALELSLLSNFGGGHHSGHHDHGASSPQSYHHHAMDQLASSLQYADEMRFLAKKSQNMTECVPVPSSEHVAEIVGRQGCKIKALRAKTNTYIKTPVRGEEPVFVVTGRKEDVGAAKREILSAAEHFSQIRASRRNGMMGQCGLAGATGLVPPPPVPGQVTIQVRVPYRVVGLVVGPKGATIKRIQQQTSTYIVTPSREKEPIFEVTGMPDSVDQARREIEAHIALRTGLVSGMDGAGANEDMMINDLTAGLTGLGLGMLGGSLDGGNHGDLINSLYNVKTQNSMRTAFTAGQHLDSFGAVSSSSTGLSDLLGVNSQSFGLRSTASLSGNTSHPFASAVGHKLDSELQTLGSGLLNSLYDSDEGISLGGSDSPTLSHSLIQPNIWSTDFGLGGGGSGGSGVGSGASSTSSSSGMAAKRSNSFGFPSAAPGVSSLDGQELHPPARRISSDPLTAIGSTLSSLSAAFQIRSGAADSDSGVRGNSASSGEDCSGSASSASASSGSASPTTTAADDSPGSSGSSTRGSLKRECIMCCEGEMVAALVPCGHKLFCMDCAQRLVPSDAAAANAASQEGEALPNSAGNSSGGECPVCHQAVTQAIRIFS